MAALYMKAEVSIAMGLSMLRNTLKSHSKESSICTDSEAAITDVAELLEGVVSSGAITVENLHKCRSDQQFKAASVFSELCDKYAGILSYGVSPVRTPKFLDVLKACRAIRYHRFTGSTAEMEINHV